MKRLIYLTIVFTLIFNPVWSQRKKKKNTAKQDTVLKADVLSNLKFRSIGPAFCSGRVSDIAVNPDDNNIWYVSFGSSGIWKTTNNGQTFDPIFDNYGSYSIGCLAIDPNNPNVIWAGTGENNSQRALGYGDGVYKSVDGGKSWKNMGLKKSFQISYISIDPRNSNIVYVAAEGSVWGPGGDRGLYKTTDGGKTWNKILEVSENTGISQIIFDPRNPDILYAVAHQRRRRQYTKIDGGPESAVYKSEDAGKNWRKIMKGLPKCDIGGMWLAISPVNPDYLYLKLEAQNKQGGFYRSTDRGESWTRMSDHTSSGQYFREIYADPVQLDKVYSLETVSKYTTDGGKTWNTLGQNKRHVDDHALWIDPKNTKHFIIGGDGGVYITYDGGKNYRHIALPTVQYYRVSVDNIKPFYNIYGGTQDNNSHYGPSQTIISAGIPDYKWTTTIGGDGFWSVPDTVDQNIIYAEYQYGNVYKYFRNTGEKIYIKPFPDKDELTYKWYWNAPFLISPFDHNRLYMAANKVFRSDDGGLSWKEISNDLSAKIDRHSFKVMGKYWSSDAVAKDVSTSQYGLVVYLAQSPVKQGLVFAGTDDGLVWMSENADADNPTWTKLDGFPGLPQHTFVSDIMPSNFDENTVFVTFDNTKSNDLKPYVYKSTDKGKTWTKITGGLPENGSVHTIAQDFVNKNLLFCGTEFGFYVSFDSGKRWIKFSNGLPTISVRDIALQRSENDIVIATFGRGFYVLDDYSPLRKLSEDFLKNNKAYIFDIPVAKMYMQTEPKYGQGSTPFFGKNPEFGATFTYYLKDVPKTDKQKRQETEKEQFKNGQYIKQLSWRQMEDENREIAPYLVFTIADADGNIIRKLTKKASKGISRITWDMTFPSPSPVKDADKNSIFKNSGSGLFVMPGTYKVKMGMFVKGSYKDLTGYKSFKITPITNKELTQAQRKDYQEFAKQVMDMSRIIYATTDYYHRLYNKLADLKKAAMQAPADNYNTIEKINRTVALLDSLNYRLYGPKAKASWEEVPPQIMPIVVRFEAILQGHWEATHTVTQTERKNFAIVKEQFRPVYEQIKEIGTKTIPNIEKELENQKAPYTPDQLPDFK